MRRGGTTREGIIIKIMIIIMPSHEAAMVWEMGEGD